VDQDAALAAKVVMGGNGDACAGRVGEAKKTWEKIS